jgi:cytochrome c-type biogenesis protein CcmF
VKTGATEDVYLTITRLAEEDDPNGPVTIRVLVFPLVLWIWVGGGIMGFGTVLAMWPGRRRRRPTDPTSAPIELDPEPGPDPELEPVG